MRGTDVGIRRQITQQTTHSVAFIESDRTKTNGFFNQQRQGIST